MDRVKRLFKMKLIHQLQNHIELNLTKYILNFNVLMSGLFGIFISPNFDTSNFKTFNSPEYPHLIFNTFRYFTSFKNSRIQLSEKYDSHTL